MNTENARRASTGERERACRCMSSALGRTGNALAIIAPSSVNGVLLRQNLTKEKLKNQKCTNKPAGLALPRTLFYPLLLTAENEGESGQEILKTEKKFPLYLRGDGPFCIH